MRKVSSVSLGEATRWGLAVRMEIVVALCMAVGVVVAADRLMLWLESRGHVNWRRTGPRRLNAEPETELELLLKDS